MKNTVKTIVLMGSLAALVIGIGALVAPAHLYLFGALAVAMNLGAYFFSDRIVLRMHGARELAPADAPDLHAMVAELSVRAGVPRPRLYLIPGDQPNAFATGRNPKRGVVAITEGLIRLLDRRELRGVIAHEIAHIRNRDILISSVAAAGAAAITYVANAVALGGLFGGGQEEDDAAGASGGLLAALVAPLAATLIQLGISRSREYLADETGARIAGDPEALARALLKLEQAAAVIPAETSPASASLFIVNPFGGTDALQRWFSTHPRTANRVRRLRELDLAQRGTAGFGRRPAVLGEW